MNKNGHKKTAIVSHNDGHFNKFQWLIYSIYTLYIEYQLTDASI